MDLGVCYFPEHWPASWWERDAHRMAEAGLRFVRIGEFAWSAIEPDPGTYDWSWLDRAVDVLGGAGLEIVLCTPTATPPKWLVDAHPDILQVDAQGRTRRFGSRRHYCANSPVYRRETQRIVAALADRYGRHEALSAWQTDNEYGCHDTVRCYCSDCRDAFRSWLEDRYGSIEAVNEAWWTAFWSQTYREFREIDLPTMTVTEANPSHVLDFQRFSSDSFVAYNRLQVDQLRARSDAPICHNMMLLFGDLDAHALSRDLDFVAWDNYPLGMLEVSNLPDTEKSRFARIGHPDLVSFHHDLYRGAKGAPFWVMEQQPGSVNWAPSNPLPAPGAVRLWTHQAFAHGAEVVSYFRWRQAAGAQEMLHAGLVYPDGTTAPGLDEASSTARELPDSLREKPYAPRTPAETFARRPSVALVFDYESLWATHIQPHAAEWNYWALQFDFYRAIRRLSIDVDIVPVSRDLHSYRLVVAPALHLVDEDRAARLEAYVSNGGHLVLGPRSGAKDMSGLARNPAPGLLRGLTSAISYRSDALRPGLTGRTAGTLGAMEFGTWADVLQPVDADVVATYEDPTYRPSAAVTQHMTGSGGCTWVGAWYHHDALTTLFDHLLTEAGLETRRLPDGVRVSSLRRRTILNFGSDDVVVGRTRVAAHDIDVAAETQERRA